MKNGYSSHVRFTAKQYAEVLLIVKRTGKTIPQLLRDALLSQKLPAPKIPIEYAKTLHVDLVRIGTNINQIAKNLNSGFRAGYIDEFISLTNEVSQMRKELAKYANA